MVFPTRNIANCFGLSSRLCLRDCERRRHSIKHLPSQDLNSSKTCCKIVFIALSLIAMISDRKSCLKYAKTQHQRFQTIPSWSHTNETEILPLGLPMETGLAYAQYEKRSQPNFLRTAIRSSPVYHSNWRNQGSVPLFTRETCSYEWSYFIPKYMVSLLLPLFSLDTMMSFLF